MWVAPVGARVVQRVGEHEAPFGVGVDDLDRLPVRGAQDVAGPVRVAVLHVLGRRDDGEDAHGQAELGDRRRRLDHRARRRTCRPSCPACAAAGLSEMPPESNVIALPTRPSVGASAGAGRVVAQDDQLRLLGAARRDGGERAHALSLDPVAAVRLDGEVRRGEVERVLGERDRGELVRRQVREVAGARRCAPRSTAWRSASGCSAASTSSASTTLGPVRVAALAQARVVGAERRALDERAHLVGRRSSSASRDLPGDRPAGPAQRARRQGGGTA